MMPQKDGLGIWRLGEMNLALLLKLVDWLLDGKGKFAKFLIKKYRTLDGCWICITKNRLFGLVSNGC